MIPSIEQVTKCYRVIAQIERAKTGRPSDDTITNVLRGAKRICIAAGLSPSDKVNVFTRKTFDKAIAYFIGNNISRLSAWSYISQCRGLFAKWCLPYYKDAGWKIPKIELPVFRATAPRYIRPSTDLLQRVKNWYKCQEGEYWFAATMMLEFAMRNGDVLRLKSSNFVLREDKHYLSYTPHKTELSSGRRVYWPIHNDIWTKFTDYGGLDGIDVTRETFETLNRDLRMLGFHGAKACYELRKICIDHVYQKFGAEMAVSISGDAIRTITKYYADPAQPNLGAIRIIDLI